MQNFGTASLRLPGGHLANSTYAGSLTAGPDGNVWFSAANFEGEGGPVVGKVSPAGELTEYEALNGAGSIVAGSDGNFWFAESNGIARITPAGQITSFPVAAGGPRALTAGPDANVWFVSAKPAAAGFHHPCGRGDNVPAEGRRRSQRAHGRTERESLVHRAQSGRFPGSLAFLPPMTIRTSGIRQPSIWASVVSDDALALRDWLLALGFSEDLMIPGERERSIHHCQLDWPEGGRVMLSSTDERTTPCRPGTSSLHVVTADPDAVMARAQSVGATVVHELVDQTDYPSRDFTIADPDGNHWTFATFSG